ncbi:MAG: hypothetical protein M3Z24_14175 [Chloroflexota bacterium]|nr:hypothetical protein [Chloroflexota bacterium]
MYDARPLTRTILLPKHMVHKLLDERHNAGKKRGPIGVRSCGIHDAV